MKKRGMLGWFLINNLKQSSRWNKRNSEERHSGHKLQKEFKKERKEGYLSKLFLLLVIAAISHYACPFFSLFSPFTQLSATGSMKKIHQLSQFSFS